MYYQFSDNEFGDIYNKAEKTVKLLRLSKYEEQVIKEVERIDNCRSEINQSR